MLISLQNLQNKLYGSSAPNGSFTNYFILFPNLQQNLSSWRILHVDHQKSVYLKVLHISIERSYKTTYNSGLFYYL